MQYPHSIGIIITALKICICVLAAAAAAAGHLPTVVI
jgi:hypothetical protein